MVFLEESQQEESSTTQPDLLPALVEFHMRTFFSLSVAMGCLTADKHGAYRTPLVLLVVGFSSHPDALTKRD